MRTLISPMKFSIVFRIFLLEYSAFHLILNIGYLSMLKYRENPVFGEIIFLHIPTISIVRDISCYASEGFDCLALFINSATGKIPQLF